MEDSVCSVLEHTAGDGKTYSAKYYNLDAADQGVFHHGAEQTALGNHRSDGGGVISDFDREIKRIEGKQLSQ